MSFLKKLFGNSPKIMDWREFTEYFARQGKEALGGGSEIEWGKSLEDTTVILTPPDQIEYRSYLGNLYAEYKKLAEQEKKIVFGGRLGEYKYYDMDAVIASALDMCDKELA